MKRLLTSLLAAAFLSTAAAVAQAESATAPKSVIHVVTVTWKKDSTPEQIKAALDGAHKLTESFKGIKRVWTKTLKAQGERKQVIAMEFESEQALKDYDKSPAQQEWYKAYMLVREASTTFDVTNE